MTTKKRGRPPTGKTASELARERKRKQRARLKEQRKRLEEAGGKQLEVALDPASVDALLVCIGAHGQITVSELVGRLLRAEAARVRQ